MRASGRAARQTLGTWLMRKSGSIVHHDLIFKVVIFFVSHPSRRLLDMQHKSGFKLCRALKHHCKCNVASKWLEAELEGTVAPLPRERERERKKRSRPLEACEPPDRTETRFSLPNGAFHSCFNGAAPVAKLSLPPHYPGEIEK